MKTIILSIIFLFLMNGVVAQTYKFQYDRWSDNPTYLNSPEPIIKGNTFRSDSLAKVMNAREVYEHDSTFYFINSWADYYLWYTAKYPYKFRLPELYELYYNAQDNYNMVRFVSENFTERYYPTRIVPSLSEVSEKRDRHYESWLKKIMADNKRKEMYLKRSHEPEIRRYNNPHITSTFDDYPYANSQYNSQNLLGNRTDDVPEKNEIHDSANKSKVVEEEQTIKQ